MHVHVVKFDPAEAARIRSGLERAGHDVTVADDGRVALLQARDLESDLMIVDVILPGRSGFSVVSAVRKMGVCEHIIMVGPDESRYRDHAESIGASHYLVSPFKMNDLLASMEEISQGDRHERQASHRRGQHTAT